MMSDYVESSFKQRKINDYEKKYMPSDESLKGLFVTGQREKEIRDSLNATEDIFIERYSEEEIPKEQLENRIEEEYKKNHDGVLLSSFQKGKRANASQKKIKNQKRLRKEMELFVNRKEEDRAVTSEYLNEKDADSLKKHYKSAEQKEFLQNWIIGYDKEEEVDKVRKDSLATEEGNDRFREYNRFMLEMVNDKVDYSYASDKQFLSRLAEKYDSICRFASLRVVLNEYDASGPDAYPDFLSRSELRARVEHYEGLKAHYEDMMRLISSPYYALLSRVDLVLGGIKDEKIKDYIKLYEKCRNSIYAKGASAQKEYEKILDRYRKEAAQESVKTLHELGDEVGFGPLNIDESVTQEDAENAGAEMMDKVYENKKSKLIASYPLYTPEFFDKVPPFTGDSLIEGMGPESLMLFESKFKEILSIGEYNGTVLDKAVAEKTSGLIEEYSAARREYLADEGAFSLIKMFVDGLGFDMQNPEFQKTPEYKTLDQFSKTTVYDKLRGRITEDRKKMFESLINVFECLTDNGISISEKYEERLKKKGDKEIEENTPEGGYPELTLNGKEYTLYVSEDVPEELKGKDIRLKGEEGRALEAEIEEISELNREIIKYNLMLKGHGDERGMMYRVLKGRILKKREMHFEAIRKILEKNGIGKDKR